MNTLQCLEQLESEIQEIPEEFLPKLISMVKSYRETLQIEESFKQSWQEVRKGEIYPIEQLWNGNLII